ncbi:uncharacterized protein EI90DRAFT_3068577 [Cantharellus anzutake]|uniref:uncharacterized protein n=1 Tax=Cantharellus anzutake TaxID=1750568 RepID=UPI001903C2BE|nr:uncharacterized protein EI90DRAFT_3068577 [Cantharellus anzutake]KAF8327287.1 hypothetical protein EI90DRAFT_3068577 [Cantharellus anzutake]
MLEYEWERRWGKKQGSIYSPKGFKPVPSAAEERMGRDDRRLKKVAERVAFMNSLDKDAGGHVFPRIRPTSSARNSKIQTFIISQQHTRTILSLCKSHHATVTNAIFVLVTFAWLRLVASRTDPRNARVSEAERKRWKAIGSERMPIMMYTAINLQSNIFLALGYLNVVLPGFLPHLALEQCESDEEARKVLERTFWLRVRSVRDQHTKVLSSPLFRERAERAKAWAVIDDYEEELTTAKAEGGSRVAPKQPRVPSVALLGVSLLANLDNLYLPSNFPALNLFDILNGTRKNTGGILLMGYTFRGRIYSTLGWDSRSFEPGVVEEFFEKFEATLKEFLLPSVEGVVFERGLECRSKAAEQARL